MKVATYCRFSSANQKDTSIDDQFRICTQYAEREGWKIEYRYEDRAISGTDADRPDYQRMLTDAKARCFNVLLVHALSRLGRDEVETKQTIKRLKFYGVRLIAVADGIDTAHKGSKLNVAFKAMQNEAFLDDLKENIDRGMTGQALKGYSCGGKPYGYRPRPIYSPTEKDTYGRPVIVAVDRDIDPEQEKWVCFIYEKYADGWSPRRIADHLNAHKVPSPGSTWKRVTRRCSGWVGSSVMSILSNPAYSGKLIWKRSRFEKDPDTNIIKRFDRAESEWITVKKPELRIVDQKTFDMVQARREALAVKNKEIQAEQGKTARYSAPHKYLFSGLLVCSVCGANYVIKSSVENHRFGCSGHSTGGKHLCSNNLLVSRSLLEQKLLTGIAEELFSDEAIKRLRSQVVRLAAERKRKARPDAEAARKRLAEIEPQIANIIKAIEDGMYSPALKAKLAEAEGEAERLRPLLNVDTRQVDKVTDFLPRVVDDYRALVRDMPATLGRDVARARAQLRHLIGPIRLVPEDDHLVAELQGNYAGLFKLATGTAGDENRFGRGRGI